MDEKHKRDRPTKKEYDFFKAERGKFYRPDAKLNFPVYLDDEVREFVTRIAENTHADVSQVVNDLLRSDMNVNDNDAAGSSDMTLVCGADGCRRGWVGVSRNLETKETRWAVFPTFLDLVRQKPCPSVVAVDIPIGLLEKGARRCDMEARRLLGPGRASSVFPAPIRCVLAASSYQEASSLRREVEGKGLSVQTWAIVPKIREVDEALRREATIRTCVREVHPEVCFWRMAGQHAIKESKRSRAGQARRRDLLVERFGDVVDRALADRGQLGCVENDVLDAFAALWTAQRIAEGVSEVLPSAPPKDQYGLPMQMVI
ncbi:MAG: DUF429 domain-containing protein [Candidatus Sumerlaeota bacterium]|nr:DUF429 domain-containing protein [Candidatus Sumerlaeota bacterium]